MINNQVGQVWYSVTAVWSGMRSNHGVSSFQRKPVYALLGTHSV